MKKMEMYFHIPFCVRKCKYCDFLSMSAEKKVQDAYMQALLKEVEGRAEEYREYVIDTLFIGGGTPSVVEAFWIKRLMDTVYQNYTVSREPEVTIEVNPGTVDGEKLKVYRRAGINRLSIGLQSAKNEELECLGRIHTWEDFLQTYSLANTVGFDNINVDVMSALPGQTVESYCRTLEKIMQLNPPPKHISAYSLIVEEGTPFAAMYENGILQLPDEDSERKMYEKTAELLGAAGYTRYEISNYGQEGYACRHNCGYWQRTDYVGFGIGAASLVDNKRFQNDIELQYYLDNPLACRSNLQELGVKEQMEEYMFLGLRMTEGVSERKFQILFGKTLEEVYGSIIRRNIADDLLTFYENEKERYLRLTQRGLDLSNYVMAQFLFDR